MNFGEATIKLKDLERYSYEPDTLEALNALKLGREAIKAIGVYRAANDSWLSLLLPGETK